MRLLILALLAAAAAAADPVGVWRFGLGTVDGQPARLGAVVLTGQNVVSADAAPLRLVCSEAPGITVVLAAGSSARFSHERSGAGQLLVLELDKGAVQVDVRDKGPYAGMRVRGGAAEVKVTGTLFTVERVRRDADYVALIRGKVAVGLRPDLAAAAGKHGEDVELLEHRGVAADGNGVGKPEDLGNRPQVHLAASLRGGLRDQGLGLNDQGTSDWDSDLAGELTGSLLEGLGGDTPESPGEAFTALAEELVTTTGELGLPPVGSGDTASHIIGGPPPSGGGGALPPPPAPP